MEEKTTSGNTAAAEATESTPVKKTTAKSKAKTQRPSHPRTSEMVNAAIKELKDRKGSSLQAIKKYIVSTYKVDGEKFAPFIKRYLKTAVTNGAVVQTKGKGASGSFKLSAESKSKPLQRAAKVTKSIEPKIIKKKKPTKKAATAAAAAAAAAATASPKKPVEKKVVASPKKITAAKTAATEKTKAAKTKAAPKAMSKAKKTAKAPAAKTKTPKPKKAAASKTVKAAAAKK